jgi:acetyl esterase/lipase
MPGSPPIPRQARLRARLLQASFPVIQHTPRALRFATRPIAPPETIRVPTRHGAVRCLVHRPHPDAPLAGPPPPVYVSLHGGAFIGRYPEQDAHLADYVASEVGAVVVNVDYDVAPQHRFPVAEEECFDVARWVCDQGPQQGWDGTRIAVGGASAGGKLAMNVAQQAHAAGGPALRALVALFAICDVTRADRTSPKRFPIVAPWLQRLARDTYFADAAVRALPLASPGFDPELADALPPTLVLTGDLDTLGPEMDALADDLARRGVDVTHRRFTATDHSFTQVRPVARARQAIGSMGAHLLRHLAPQGSSDDGIGAP